MKCRHAISSLNAYVDGELTGKHHRGVQEHLILCASCRKRLADIRVMEGLLQDTLPVPPVPYGLAARIMIEARRKQAENTHKGCSPVPSWNFVQWLAGLSASMRFAACATVLMALVTVLFLNQGLRTGPDMGIEAGESIYGLEWFDPLPPDSIGSVYIAMVEQPYE